MEQKTNKTNFLLGTGVRDITPEIGCYLVGGTAPYLSDGIATRLYVKAMAIAEADGKGKVLFVTLDNLKYPEADKARDVLADSTGIERNRIFVTASHAHSCPWYEDYGEDLINAMKEASLEALASMEPVRLSALVGAIPGVTQNRRVMKDGKCWNTWLFPRGHREEEQPAARHDILLQGLVAGRADGSKKAAVFNFACHACTSGLTPSLISADYPGYVRRKLDEKFGYPVEGLFWPGACGDVNGTKNADELGAALGERYFNLAEGAEIIEDGTIGVYTEYVVTHDRDISEFSPEEVAKTWADEVEHFRQAFEEAVDNKKDAYRLEINVITLGREVAIVTDPCELFTEIGLDIKERSPFKYTFVVEQTNGAYGYVPTEKAFLQGGYETFYGEHSFLERTAGTKIFETSLALLKESHRS